MKITVAIFIEHHNLQIADCLHAIYNQRVIKSDSIKLYTKTLPNNLPNNLIDIVNSYKAEVIQIDPSKELRSQYDKLCYIVNDNKNTDILMLISDDLEIDASAISELFRYFLKYENLSLVYGRQFVTQTPSLLTKFIHKIFFPLTSQDYQQQHLMHIFNNLNFVALRVKDLFDSGAITPEKKLPYFSEFYIAAKLYKFGKNIMYNPLAIARCENRVINSRHIYRISKALRIFLASNKNIGDSWHISSSDSETFFYNFKEYLIENSSIPFIQFYATYCFLVFKIGETIGDFIVQHFSEFKVINKNDSLDDYLNNDNIIQNIDMSNNTEKVTFFKQAISETFRSHKSMESLDISTNEEVNKYFYNQEVQSNKPSITTKLKNKIQNIVDFLRTNDDDDVQEDTIQQNKELNKNSNKDLSPSHNVDNSNKSNANKLEIPHNDSISVTSSLPTNHTTQNTIQEENKDSKIPNSNIENAQNSNIADITISNNDGVNESVNKSNTTNNLRDKKKKTKNKTMNKKDEL